MNKRPSAFPISSSFTLIELMAASTVLSVVLLMMLGMQDQMSKAWTNANRRTDATREARAGLRMLSEDFLHYYIRDSLTNSNTSRSNYNPTTNRIPIVFFANATTTISNLTIANAQSNSQALFFLSQRRPSAGQIADQVTCVGYYIAWGTNTDINGMKSTNYNLYRYSPTNPAQNMVNLSAFASGNSLTALFPDISANSEILARNAVNLKISVYPATSLINGVNYLIPESGSANYSGNRCVFELTTYPDTIASSVLQSGLTKWTDTNNLKRYGRTFEITMDIERSLSK